MMELTGVGRARIPMQNDFALCNSLIMLVCTTKEVLFEQAA